MELSIKDKTRRLLDEQTNSGKHKRRKFKDLLAKYGIATGGLSVIAAVVLICFYLLWVVLPIFKPAHIELNKEFQWQQQNLAYLGVEEYGEIAFGLNHDGHMQFVDLASSQVISQENIEADSAMSAYSLLDLKGLMAIGFADGSFKLVSQKYAISYPNDKRKITASLEYPFGEDTFELADAPIKIINGKRWEDGLLITAVTANNQIITKSYSVEESMLDDGFNLEEDAAGQISPAINVKYALATEGPDWLYLIAENGQSEIYRWRGNNWQQTETKRLTDEGTQVSQAVFLLGQTSILVGDSQGQVTQWFPVREQNNDFLLTKIRAFEFSNSAVTQIIPEARRKGFIAADSQGKIGVFYTTSERYLETVNFAQPLAAFAINSRSNKLIAVGQDGKTDLFSVENEHPEISWSALWNEVWYESYEEPSFTWQSSASTNDFESKFSLVPLSFGTFKAAFYAMLFAVPLAIFGAIFTAYFMSPTMRGMVKPTVEIMEALPTVILGFLAGLWLAPMVEENLMGIILVLVLLPILTVAFGFAWHHAPAALKNRIPDGWQAALLFPVIILGTLFAFWLGKPLEAVFFDGNMPAWLNSMGINYDQRNSMVVGIAMGFAVIPTIFSITEDAVFSVPKHLTNGSLALGASPWQTMVRVVLPTASPGIFSALMIGLGRAVGETMIVLMATGNTPIMDMNIFEGMRTLSANIAVEMPESEVGSSHYRVLFLAAFVLFLFTFAFNTIAEVVRQRLRNKYGSL
ncbi:ABC transporter permease subunit [Kangiella sp. TOML190]|uniref:ABC transporter permease subunit n=1 Tax=Kangiella sp. TOML190 TaxID=2931351 RepID=UPI002040271A|nr:ABC transporter permease subunit [Kangiella sp. TOML190]